ncbi:MAG: helix-turn-helix transcriptional regulator [Bacteroidota bacterium]
MPETIGQRICWLRQEILGLTQEEFASRLHVSRNHISTVETEKANPSESLLALIACVFCVSFDWLTTGEPPMHDPANRAAYFLRAIGPAAARMEDLTTPAKRIRYLRAGYGLTRKDFARQMHKEEEYIARLESGKVEMTEEDAKLFHHAVKANAEWLLKGEGLPLDEEGINWIAGQLVGAMKGAAPGFPVALETVLDKYNVEQAMAICRRKYGDILIRHTLGEIEAGEIDQNLNEILQGIVLFWGNSSPELKTWFKVQFNMTFPMIEELKKSLTESSATKLA